MSQYIKESVNRFLGWKLPADFYPDAGITFKRDANPDSPIEYQYKHEPTGTNLFNDPQATAMLTHVCKPLTDRVAKLDAESNHFHAVAKAAISFLKDGEVKMVYRITELEALCLNALYQHQGASSAVGQPIRKALGMGEFDRITEAQLKIIHGVRAHTQP